MSDVTTGLQRILGHCSVNEQSVRRAAWTLVRESGIEDGELYRSLRRGKAVLETDAQCAKYVTAFSNKHLVKFQEAFKSIPEQTGDRVVDFVDWGCGVGLAELAYSSYIKISNRGERKYDYRVRSISLIEPSEQALAWAEFIAASCFPEARVISINKRFEELDSEDVKFDDRTGLRRIHVFSNVLDMDAMQFSSSFDGFVRKFRDLALGRDDVVILISPDYNAVVQAYRRFESILTAACSVKVLVDAKSIRENGVSAVMSVLHVMDCELVAKFDSLLPVWRRAYDRMLLDERSGVDEMRLLDFVRNQCETKRLQPEQLRVYYKPNALGYVPDLVLLAGSYAPIIFCIRKKESRTVHLLLSKRVKNRLFECSPRLFAMATNSQLFAMVTAVDFVPGEDCLYYYKSRTEPDAKIDRVPWRSFGEFDEIDAREVRKAVSDLFMERTGLGHAFELDAKQKRLSRSRANVEQKVNGVFGSGKTTVLVARAIDAYRRTHRQVLILTFNVSLRNHIESLIARHFDAPFTADRFLVLNFHEFLMAEANFAYHQIPQSEDAGKSGLPVAGHDSVIKFAESPEAFQVMQKFSRWMRQYSTILIDECQDYKYEWLEIVKRIFLREGGEYVLFGDEKQNVYNRELDGNRSKTNISGNWNKLTVCHRAPGVFMEKISQFQRLMMKYDVDPAEQGVFEYADGFIVCYDVQAKMAHRLVMRKFVEEAQSRRIPFERTVVLNDSHAELRKYEFEFRKMTGSRKEHVEVMFWRDDDLQVEQKRLAAIAERMRREGKESGGLAKMDRERRLKLFFDGDQVSRIKFATIKSFKGFESDYVCLIVDRGFGREAMLELIYAGLTRARKGLFVYNCGNEAARSVLRNLGDAVMLKE